MKMGMRACVWVLAAVPAAAWGQMTGVSHPDQVPITTSAEGVQQPVVYEGTAAPVAAAPGTPALKVRVVETEPEAHGAAFAASSPAMPRDEFAAVSAAPRIAHDVDADVVTRLPGGSNELPAGTMLKVKLHQEFDTLHTKEGTRFAAPLLASVERDGRVLLPAGSVVSGMVTEVHGGRRIGGPAALHLRPMEVTLPDGTHYRMAGQVIDTSEFRETKVDREGTILRKDHPMKTLGVMSLTTGSAAAAGGVFGGVPGALIGAGIGAGVSTAWWLKQDRQTGLPDGATVTFSLTESLAVQ